MTLTPELRAAALSVLRKAYPSTVDADEPLLEAIAGVIEERDAAIRRANAAQTLNSNQLVMVDNATKTVEERDKEIAFLKGVLKDLQEGPFYREIDRAFVRAGRRLHEGEILSSELPEDVQDRLYGSLG